MSERPDAVAELMTAVPAPMRQRIVSGMRWTFWLSVAAVPFSYATSVLLARTGPEVIGTYGLLMVYIGVVASLFYLGGDAVIIKFVPELSRDQRLPFLLSYLVVVFGFLAVWLAVASAWPRSLQYLFGHQGGSTTFQLTVIYLSPLYILFSLTVAGHKAVLDMRTAQIMTRVLTVGSFVFYAVLYFGMRRLLATHYMELVWGIYLGLTCVTTVLGVRHLLKLNEWRADWRAKRFFLPKGFWPYTLATEQVSAVSFFLQRLDLMLIMNFGGLQLLGMYVAIVTLAETIRTANRFFLDTLLPSLTNTLAAGEIAAASQLFAMNFRLLLLVNLAGATALMLLIDPILLVFGPQYVPLRSAAIVMLLGYGLSAPAMMGGTLLSSIGKPQRAFWVYVGQLALFIALFLLLWPKWQLMGAAVASGGSLLATSAILLIVAKSSAPHVVSGGKQYGVFVVIGLLTAAAAQRWTPVHIVFSLVTWACAMGVFLVAARYTFAECRQLAACFLPSSVVQIQVRRTH